MSELKKQLDFLSNLRNQDEFVIPDDSGIKIFNTPKLEHTKKKKKKKKSIDDVLDETEKFINELKDDDFDYDFETYIEDAIFSEEDENLKTTLVGLGRKYARKHGIDEDESEVNKAFAPQEKELNTLITELTKDRNLVQNDIDKMRSSGYGANRKMLAEMIGAKTQLHNATLAAIKEKNNIKKIKFDIINKSNANKKTNDESESSLNSSKIIQEILSGGQSSLLDSVGGREGSSGCPSDSSLDEDPNLYIDAIENSDEYIQKKYFNSNESSEGDKFIKYENDDVKYILLVDDENNTKNIIAEDKYGNIVPDYPVPSNINELNFSINKDSNIATDQLNRTYEIREL